MNFNVNRNSSRRQPFRARTLFYSSALSTLAFLLMPGAAFPQTRNGDEPSVTVLDPIIITARKREETDRSVPISTTVVSQDDLERIAGGNANSAISALSPNYHFINLGGQYSNFGVIRGVGSFSPLSPDDTSVLFNVDEVPTSVFSPSPSLLDVKRVEVLRGPQGTLFGRNAQAGAVSFVTNDPTFSNDLWLRSEIGSNGYWLGEAIGNATLIPDVLAGRLALRYSSQNGDIRNIATGGRDGDVRIGAARGSLLWTPDAETRVRFSLSYGKDNDTIPRFISRWQNGDPVSALQPENRFDRESLGANLRIEREFDSFRFYSTTSFQDASFGQTFDLTDGILFGKLYGVPPTYFNVPGTNLFQTNADHRIFTQEFRVSSLEDSLVQWTAGLNYYRSDFRTRSESQNITLPVLASYIGKQDNQFTTNSYSAFGEMTVPIVGDLKATLGGRISREETAARYRYSSGGVVGVAPFYTQDSSIADTLFSGRAALSYQWTPEVMTYASVARGYVPAGFSWQSVNTVLGRDEPFFPASTSWTYETGVKASLFDGNVDLKASAFYNDVRDGHLFALNPGQTVFQIATLDYYSAGAEVEMAARLHPNWTLSGGVGYTHAELTDVPANSLTRARSGNRVPNVPTWTARVGLEYRQPFELFGTTGDVFAGVSYNYVSSRAADVQNNFDLKPYGLVNARLGWSDGKNSAYLFGTNLLDERYEVSGAFYGPNAFAIRPGQGRVVGFGMTTKF